MNVFDLAARITLDTSDYEQGLDDASKKSSSLASKIGSGLKTAAKVGAAALTAASTAIGVLTKQSIENYANYEQLAGGVETLFGAGGKSIEEYAESVGKSVSDVEDEYQKLMSAQTRVMADASVAYKTAGMSANQYMETVTGFSASLINSLDGDTEKASSVANRIITDMSDNANKMGTSMELIQNAYQGFSKQNYTMLDNLKLGYGGTKEEMARLIKDASKMTDVQKELGIEVDASSMSFSNIANAISVVQTKMGITGTTAREASETISGSVASAKAAWQNLITVMASTDPEDISNLSSYVERFTDSVKTAAGNIIPVVSQALIGIGQVIQDLAPIISEQLPVLIETVLPSLLDAGTNLLMGVINGIITALPNLIDPVIQLITQFGNFIIENLPLLIDAALQIVKSLADGLATALPELIPAAIDMIMSIVDTLIDNIDMLIDAAIEIILALADGLIDALPRLIEKIPIIITKLLSAIIENAPKLISAGLELIISLGLGLIKAIPQLIKNLPQIITSIVEGLMGMIGDIVEVGKNIVSGIWDGIKKMGQWIKDKVKGFFTGIVDGIKGLLGIHSPSKVFAGIGEYMAEGLGEGWDDAYGKIERDINKDLDFSGNITTSGSYSGYGKPYETALPGATFNITVNGANIQNDQALAEKIAYEMQRMYDRRLAVFGA